MDELTNLEKENEYLKNELENQKNNYKQVSAELRRSIFEAEDLDDENRKLKKKIANLEEEIEELKKFREEVESSTHWKLKSLFR